LILLAHVGPPLKLAESTLRQLLTPLILLHLYPRALLQLSLQTVSAPSTVFSKGFSTDPSFAIDEDDVKGKGKALEKPRGVGAGAGEKAARINAAMMALVDAGVQCRGMLVAVTVAFVPSSEGEEEVRLDPSPAEEDEATSAHVFAFSFGQGVGEAVGTCVGVDSVGLFSEDQVRFSSYFANLCPLQSLSPSTPSIVYASLASPFPSHLDFLTPMPLPSLPFSFILSLSHHCTSHLDQTHPDLLSL
jgi:hypothetical protein